MTDSIEVKSLQYYFKKYGTKVANGERISSVKESLLREFMNEVFGMILFKAGGDDISTLEHTKKNEEIICSVTANAEKKWASLVRKFDMYRETCGMLTMKDLEEKLFPEEEPDDETDAE